MLISTNKRHYNLAITVTSNHFTPAMQSTNKKPPHLGIRGGA